MATSLLGARWEWTDGMRKSYMYLQHVGGGGVLRAWGGVLHGPGLPRPRGGRGAETNGFLLTEEDRRTRGGIGIFLGGYRRLGGLIILVGFWLLIFGLWVFGLLGFTGDKMGIMGIIRKWWEGGKANGPIRKLEFDWGGLWIIWV